VAVQDVDRAKNLVVLADSSDRVVTVLKVHPDRRVGFRKGQWGRR
jgi:hypothetical protein